MDRLNWNYILTHPSEFVRLDEHLRLKQIELDEFHSRIEGWTRIAAQEHLDHQRMIYSMRCYLSITCTNRFGMLMLSQREFESLKNSFFDRDNYLSADDKQYETLNHLTYNEYYLILRMASDRKNTERIYRKLLGQLLDEMDECEEPFTKEAMIDTIINKCLFTIE
jgi:hypothetical protein